MADVQQPLLGRAAGADPQSKASECALVDTCFLSSGDADPGASAKEKRKLIIACILCFAFMCIEVAGGYYAGSVAIMADAAHMMSDVAGFGVSLFATIVVSRRSSTWSYSFGYHRAEIIGALLSIMMVWAVTGALVWEAVLRILNPRPVDGKIMVIISVAGIIFNLIACNHAHAPAEGNGHAHGGSKEKKAALEKKKRNMNMEAAALHVLGDLVQSIGVAIAGALIWYFQDDPRWLIADPLCTFLFAILVVMTTVSIIRDIMHTLMERAPHNVPGVQDVHDLHVWSLSSSIPILTAHIHKNEGADSDQVLEKVEHYIRKAGIRHSTVQICNPIIKLE
eukprot:gene5074-34872_t